MYSNRLERAIKKYISYLLFFVAFSCKKANINTDVVDVKSIKIQGHAGMGENSIYPRNSFESVSKCLSLGSDGSEVDVQLTKDSVLVAFHDYELSETSNMSGLIHSHTWEEIKNGHYSYGPISKFTIMSLDELYSSYQNIKDYYITFDCKLNPENNTQEYHETFSRSLY